MLRTHSMRTASPRPGLAFPAVLVAAVACGGGGGGSPTIVTPPPSQPAWTAVELAVTCPRGSGSLPNSSCRVVRVAGPGVAPLAAELRILEPASGVAFRGTVIVGSGGYGDFFLGDQAGGKELFGTLTSLGYRVVDRAWQSSWWGSGAGLRVESHRYATLLTWVHDNLHTTGTFCAVGNSSGGGEIAYALTSWDRAQLLDAVVLMSGPPHTRLDWVCASTPTAAWSSRCAALVPPGVLTCGAVACSLTVTNEGAEVCAASGSNELLQQSILHPQATVDFGSTRVHVVIGTEDCGNPTVSALLFHDAVTSDKSLEFALGTPHLVASTGAGRAAITRALLAATANEPATLSTVGWPRVGGVFELRVHGLPGEAYEVFLGLEPGLASLEPAGFWFLSAPFVSLGGGRLDGSGLATFRWPVPATPALQGVSLYDQATAGGRFTNAVRVIVRP